MRKDQTKTLERQKPIDDNEIFTDNESEPCKPLIQELESYDHKAKRINTSIKDSKIELLENIAITLRTNKPNTSIGYRELERNRIVQHLIRCIKDSDSEVDTNNCMIIFGQPGLGKTALLSEIFTSLKHKDKESYVSQSVTENKDDLNLLKKKKWKIHFYNAVTFACTADLLKEIANNVFGHKLDNNSTNADFILKLIKSDIKILLQEYYLVIMIDELEYLLNSDKRDFNTIINFLNINDTGFVKFGISNTVNIISEGSGIAQKLVSSFLSFKPYNRDQLKGILLSRVNSTLEMYDVDRKDFISDAVIDYLVKNIVNNYSSDVRMLLAMCNGIIEEKIQFTYKLLAQNEEITKKNTCITIPDVIDYLLKNAFNKQVEIIKRLGILSQLVLLAVCVSMGDKGQTLEFKDVENMYQKLLYIYEMDTDCEIFDQLDILKNYSLIEYYGKPIETVKIMFTQQELDRCIVQIEGFEDWRHKVKMRRI